MSSIRPHINISSFKTCSLDRTFVLTTIGGDFVDKNSIKRVRCQINRSYINKRSMMHLKCRPPASFSKTTATTLQQEQGPNDSAGFSNFIKICGVTNAEDAIIAASNGANLIGMILWPKAKRSISTATARDIATAVRGYGASPVAVFVDEDAETIQRVCDESTVDIAQLHGDGARSALAQLPAYLKTIYVMHADKLGVIQTPRPSSSSSSSSSRYIENVDWVLLDSLQGGSGERFDWSRVHHTTPAGKYGWLLAGGLTPDNVAEAIHTARPTGVDVSSGVCRPDGLRKDVMKVRKYISQATAAFSSIAS